MENSTVSRRFDRLTDGDMRDDLVERRGTRSLWRGNEGGEWMAGGRGRSDLASRCAPERLGVSIFSVECDGCLRFRRTFSLSSNALF